MSILEKLTTNSNTQSQEAITLFGTNLGAQAKPYKEYLRDSMGQKIKDGRYDKREDSPSKLRYQFATVGPECKTASLLTPIDKSLPIEPFIIYEITAYGYSFPNGGYWLTELVDIKPLVKLEEAPLTRNSGGKV